MIFDTIVAKTTANGVSAINLIRVSGTESIEIVNKIFKGKDLTKQKSHTIHYGYIFKEEEQIDEVLVYIYRAPKTFTKEDIIEIACHGGNLIANEIIKLIIANGARLAENGEFTKRAYLNGRLDLTEAESIMDMVNAKNYNQLKIANSQLRGDVLKLVENLQNDVLDIIANIEVNIDYPEYDDVEEMTNDIIIPNIKILKEKIETILRESQTGQIIRDGIKTVIVGKPNVGKSSLLNSLLKEDKAIVTEISGTTRDLIEAELNLDGVILKLIDTAGIRSTEDIVEKIGINKSKKAIEEADLILLVLDQSESLTDTDKELLSITSQKPRIIIGNKIDLGSKISLENEHIINISVKNNIGLDKLSDEVKRLFIDEKLLNDDFTILSNTRHIGKLEETKKALSQALDSAYDLIPIDMVEIDLRNAWTYLGEITGENSSDDLISTLFSKFCLGK
ncbi:MAG: tRNA uridine-5-carboxymethylaminomethyl(34) synthesis GTPase MnmE [Candidatus Izemoplasmatales bacterium]|jgi:tRNA modification GTPase|nr:tRNA uridine-5-carboxymethylaminomethyl(34) synthesis GTPase MnmE [Candidatus Izemoplasmatales bacterium]